MSNYVHGVCRDCSHRECVCKPPEQPPEVPDELGLYHDRPITEGRVRPAKSVKVPKVPAPDEVWVVADRWAGILECFKVYPGPHAVRYVRAR